jgi:hypothetical protein
MIQKGNLAPLTYLAVPYTYKHRDKRIVEIVQRFRFELATRAMGWLINTYGWNVFSPITHSHPVHVMCPDVRGDWEFWKKIDTEYLQISQRIVVLTVPGWRKSTGVTAEIEIANQLGHDVFFLHPAPDEDFYLSTSPKDESYNISVNLV